MALGGSETAVLDSPRITLMRPLHQREYLESAGLHPDQIADSLEAFPSVSAVDAYRALVDLHVVRAFCFSSKDMVDLFQHTVALCDDVANAAVDDLHKGRLGRPDGSREGQEIELASDLLTRLLDAHRTHTPMSHARSFLMGSYLHQLAVQATARAPYHSPSIEQRTVLKTAALQLRRMNAFTDMKDRMLLSVVTGTSKDLPGSLTTWFERQDLSSDINRQGLATEVSKMPAEVLGALTGTTRSRMADLTALDGIGGSLLTELQAARAADIAGPAALALP